MKGFIAGILLAGIYLFPFATALFATLCILGFIVFSYCYEAAVYNPRFSFEFWMSLSGAGLLIFGYGFYKTLSLLLVLVVGGCAKPPQKAIEVSTALCSDGQIGQPMGDGFVLCPPKEGDCRGGGDCFHNGKWVPPAAEVKHPEPAPTGNSRLSDLPVAEKMGKKKKHTSSNESRIGWGYGSPKWQGGGWICWPIGAMCSSTEEVIHNVPPKVYWDDCIDEALKVPHRCTEKDGARLECPALTAPKDAVPSGKDGAKP